MVWTILAVANLTCALLSYTFVACALARIRWTGRGTVSALVAIFLSAQIWFVPQLISAFIFNGNIILDWIWFIDWLCGCFSVVLLWHALKDVSRDRADAATMDGCGPFGIYWHVVLPLVRPALLTLGILISIASAGYFLARSAEIFRDGVTSLNWPFLVAASSGMSVGPIVVFLFARKLIPSRKF